MSSLRVPAGPASTVAALLRHAYAAPAAVDAERSFLLTALERALTRAARDPVLAEEDLVLVDAQLLRAVLAACSWPTG